MQRVRQGGGGPVGFLRQGIGAPNHVAVEGVFVGVGIRQNTKQTFTKTKVKTSTGKKKD